MRPSSEPLHGQVNRWTSSSSSRRRDLLNPYEAIIFCHARYINGEISWTQTFNRHRLQPPQYQLLNSLSDSDYSLQYQNVLYAPGSILTDPPSPLVPSTLVARVQPWSHEWKCNVSLTALGKEVVDLSFDNVSVSIGLSWDEVSKCATIGIRTCSGDEIVKSWIAQTSKLYSCLRSREYGHDLGVYIIEDVEFYIQIVPKDGDRYGPCHICNAKDRYHQALSLSVTAPVIDYRTNTIESFPVVSCSRLCGMKSLEEEDIFTVKVISSEFHARWGRLLDPTVHLTGIPELNAEHGFDPARDGADVCEYFGWPLVEILNSSTGEWILNGTISGSASVISDNPDQILSEECDSASGDTDVTRGGTEEAQAEAPTKTEIVPVVQHDISTRALIIIFIAIGIQIVLLSSFQNYL
ncbi:hypothetical protein EV421DRAFT_2035459 [Armillaria borealis]|uniref:Uncharacterized protein n=1 Tax=Armillaria borealis TaxID=47425 RepID=A0AA39JKJ6_9AGAR|nr:hypothetical protein EV421DRAFT_2035459 [Armillaria borealis]